MNTYNKKDPYALNIVQMIQELDNYIYRMTGTPSDMRISMNPRVLAYLGLDPYGSKIPTASGYVELTGFNPGIPMAMPFQNEEDLKNRIKMLEQTLSEIDKKEEPY